MSGIVLKIRIAHTVQFQCLRACCSPVQLTDVAIMVDWSTSDCIIQERASVYTVWQSRDFHCLHLLTRVLLYMHGHCSFHTCMMFICMYVHTCMVIVLIYPPAKTLHLHRHAAESEK